MDIAGRDLRESTRRLDRLIRAGGRMDPIAQRRAVSRIKSRLIGGREPASRSRYVPLERIGVGGTGVVYRAYDRDLRRELALKFLRAPSSQTEGDAHGRARLLREAQALASITHPSVISVFDVGESEDGVFVAMEYVRGMDFAQWLDRGEGDWRQALRVLLQAGEGLAAAHDAGVLHRDFKPANILLDETLRPRVIDFGLARLADDASGTACSPPVLEFAGNADGVLSSAGEESMPSLLETPLTDGGVLMGTPGYMAPEQYRGGAATALTDQFSFCVTVYEALYGRRPFPMRGAADVEALLHRGVAREAPPGVRVPRRIHRAVLRGLALAPEDRFPDMRALLRALRVDRGRVWVAVAAVALLAGGLAGGLAWHGSRAIASCEREADMIASVWGPDVAGEVRAAFVTTGLPYAADTAQRVAASLDAYRDAWRGARVASCEARALGQPSAAVRDRQNECYGRALEGLEALVGMFRQADRRTVDHAVSAVLDLPDPERCEQEALVGGEPRVPERVREGVASVREALAQVRSVLSAGAGPRAVRALVELEHQADVLGHVPLVAEVGLVRGHAFLHVHDLEEASRAYRQAYFAALSAGDDRTAVVAATALLKLHTVWLGHESGFEWGRHARAVLTRLARAEILRAELEYALGLGASAFGRVAEGLRHLELARVIYEQEMGPGALQLGDVLVGMAPLLQGMGRGDEALAAVDRAVEITRSVLGERHPHLGSVLKSRGDLRAASGEMEGALSDYSLALQMLEAGLEAKGEEFVSLLENLAIVRAGRGEFAKARALFSREYALLLDLGRHGAALAIAVQNIAEADYALGDFRAARDGYRRALEAWPDDSNDRAPSPAGVWANLARAEAAMGNDRAARRLAQRVISDSAAGSQATAPYLATAFFARGRSHLALGDASAGIADLERAVALTRAGAFRQELIFAESREALARALVARDPERAVALAGEAQAWYRARSSAMAGRLARLDAWTSRLR